MGKKVNIEVFSAARGRKMINMMARHSDAFEVYKKTNCEMKG